MKKIYIFLLSCSLIIAGNVNAQIKKGSVFLGGNLSGSTYKTKSNGFTGLSTYGFTVSPVLGIATRENLVLGGDLSFTFFEGDDDGTPTGQRQVSYGAGVFLRKYKQIGKSDFSIFADGRLGYRFYDVTYSNAQPSSNTVKRHAIGLSFYPGISYSISRKLQLEAGLAEAFSLVYSSEKRETNTAGLIDTYTTRGVAMSGNVFSGSSLYLGFRVLL